MYIYTVCIYIYIYNIKLYIYIIIIIIIIIIYYISYLILSYIIFYYIILYYNIYIYIYIQAMAPISFRFGRKLQNGRLVLGSESSNLAIWWTTNIEISP